MKSLKKQLKNKIKAAAGLHYKVFFGLFLFSSIVCILALRANNQEMVRLRNQVYIADEKGGDVNSALNNLRRHVYGHMNTDLSSGGNAIKPPIQLKYTYERLQAAEQQKVDAINERLYTQAQAHCERQNPAGISGGSRIACMEDYVLKNGAQPVPIPPGLYQFDFVSPSWSPDLAGWSMVIAFIFFLAFLASFTVENLLKAKLKPW